MDINPAGPGHALVISKAHAANLLEIAEPDLLAVTRTTQCVARAVQKRWRPTGCASASSTAPPPVRPCSITTSTSCRCGKGSAPVPDGRAPGDPEELKALAVRIREALED